MIWDVVLYYAIVDIFNSILFDLQQHGLIILALGFLVIFFILILKSPISHKFPLLHEEIKRKILLNYIYILLLLIMTTFLYWEIDVHIIDLPDPAIPYVFYILLTAIYFGFRIGLLTALLTIFLVYYYLFEPRFSFTLEHHLLDLIILCVGLVASLFIGNRIYTFQNLMKKRNDELEFLVKARDRLTAVAAHELKTPLTSINLSAQILDRQFKNKKLSTILLMAVRTIRQESAMLSEMINDLLDFSHIQNQKSNIDLEYFNLGELCKQRLELIQKIFPDHIFILKINTKQTRIFADRLSIDRVITNLLTNSGKYSSVKTKVILSIGKDRGKFIISVKDKGKGIKTEHLKKLFEPFYQVIDNKQGLGLGLYITKTLVEYHNGKIWAKSEVHKGSTFYVSLPENTPRV